MRNYSPWWICGPTRYTVPILPEKSETSSGYVYAIVFKNSTVKIGKSRTPRSRIKTQISYLETYANAIATSVALSHPTASYSKLEKRMHAKLRKYHLNGELFKCPFGVASEALVSCFDRSPHENTTAGQAEAAAATVMSPPYRMKRIPKPWFWAKRQNWFVQVNKKQVRLGPTVDEAWDGYVHVMREFGLDFGVMTKTKAFTKDFTHAPQAGTVVHDEAERMVRSGEQEADQVG